MDDAQAKIAEEKRRAAIQKAKDARKKADELKEKGAELVAETQAAASCEKRLPAAFASPPARAWPRTRVPALAPTIFCV